MTISVTRSGGYAGLAEDVVDIDTARLGAEAALGIEQAVRDLRFFDLPELVSGSEGFDFLRYQILITDGPRQHSVAFDDDGSPQTAELNKFVQSLMHLGGG